MPTFDSTQRFLRDWATLSDGERDAFRRARRALVEDLKARRRVRISLRVRKMSGVQDDVYELTWAPDGRATSSSGLK